MKYWKFFIKSIVLLLLVLVIADTASESNVLAQSANCPVCNKNPLPQTGTLDCDHDGSGPVDCTYTIPYPYGSQYPARRDQLGAYRHDIYVYDTDDFSTSLKHVWGASGNNLSITFDQGDFDAACQAHPGDTLTVAFSYILRYPSACGIETRYANSGSSFCGSFLCDPNDVECKNTCCEWPEPYYDALDDVSLPAGLEVQRQCADLPVCASPIVDPEQVYYDPGQSIDITGSGSGGLSSNYTYQWGVTGGGAISGDDDYDPWFITYTFPELYDVSPVVQYRVSDGVNYSDWCVVRLETGSADFPECGNGVLDPGEGCDDGNLESGDGCSSRCKPDLCDLGCDVGIGCDGGLACFGESESCRNPSCTEVVDCECPDMAIGSITANAVLSDPACSDSRWPLSGVTVTLNGAISQDTTDSGQTIFERLMIDTSYYAEARKSGYATCAVEDSEIFLTRDDPDQGVEFKLYKVDQGPYITVNQGNFTILNGYQPKMPEDAVAIMYDGSLFADGSLGDFGDGNSGPLDPSQNTVLLFSNYRNNSIDISALFKRVSGSNGDILYIDSSFVIENSVYELSRNRSVVMVNGDLTIEEDVRRIDATLVIKGNVYIKGGTSGSNELLINGALWVGGFVDNDRKEQVTVFSNFEYLRNSSFFAKSFSLPRIYWTKIN